jgi:hypothetical protein
MCARDELADAINAHPLAFRKLPQKPNAAKSLTWRRSFGCGERI